MTWRVGRKVGRTLYLDDKLVGVVDTPELAVQIVEVMNRAKSAGALHSAFRWDGPIGFCPRCKKPLISLAPVVEDKRSEEDRNHFACRWCPGEKSHTSECSRPRPEEFACTCEGAVGCCDHHTERCRRAAPVHGGICTECLASISATILTFRREDAR